MVPYEVKTTARCCVALHAAASCKISWLRTTWIWMILVLLLLWLLFLSKTNKTSSSVQYLLDLKLSCLELMLYLCKQGSSEGDLMQMGVYKIFFLPQSISGCYIYCTSNYEGLLGMQPCTCRLTSPSSFCRPMNPAAPCRAAQHMAFPWSDKLKEWLGAEHWSQNCTFCHTCGMEGCTVVGIWDQVPSCY